MVYCLLNKKTGFGVIGGSSVGIGRPLDHLRGNGGKKMKE
jgi:hypothetical protein